MEHAPEYIVAFLLVGTVCGLMCIVAGIVSIVRGISRFLGVEDDGTERDYL